MRAILRSALLLSVALAIPACGGGDSSPSAGLFTPAVGEPDPDFNFFGWTVAAVGDGNDSAEAMALQPDGKIVVAGYSFNGSNDDFMVARFNAWGTLDETFGAAGIVTRDIAGGNDSANGVVIQSDGKIVLVGDAYVAGSPDIALVRYNPDGSLDQDFGGTGVVTTDIWGSWEFGSAVALDAAGRIVVVGMGNDVFDEDFLVLRYDADGQLDATFGGGGTGYVFTDIGLGYDWATSVTLDSAGRIVVGGYTSDGTYDFALARYETDGTLDATFGTGGIVTTDLSSIDDDAVGGIAVQPDGKIVAVGFAYNGSNDDFAAARYETDGTLDATFGTGGIAMVDIDGNDRANAVAVQPDGGIVMVGFAGGELGVVRLTANGDPDATFDGDGIVTSGWVYADDLGSAVALQPDGRIVAAGYTYETTMDILLCRYR